MKEKKYEIGNVVVRYAEESQMRYQLEERLVSLSVSVIEFCKDFPGGKVGDYFTDQLTRATVSAALNYGEAQAAESRKDFVHKLKVALKELREGLVCLKIINRSSSFSKVKNGNKIFQETDELVSIFVASVKTSQARLNAENNKISKQK